MNCNEIDQFVSPKGLSNLEVINLSGNNLSHNILSSLGGLSSLKSLYLEDIGLNGTLDVEGLCSLKNLEELYMDWNKIDKFVNSKDCRGLKKLNTLSLEGGIETIDATIFLQSTLRSFPSLKTLELSANSFNQTMITRELHNLTTLEELILDESELHISFLQTVATYTSLKHLSMRGCELNGISQVQGSIYFRNLESLDMEETTLNNSFSQIFKPIISLKELSLSNCRLNGTLYDQGNNHLEGELPTQLCNLTELRLLDLSQKSLYGKIPSCLDFTALHEENGNDITITSIIRSIEFHPARKVFSGLSNGGENGDFKLEALNPSGSKQKKTGTGQGQGPSGGSGKKADGSEFWDCGLDPELSFGMTFRRIFDLVILKGNWYVTGSEIPGAGLENLGNTCFLNSALNV
ncbi:hypothetical protein Patl1_14677 [Pistacia atlantica]|uniref:Uncharacterized protein n=1 Tax=Pistacia atlantica TaxID=434234 RepID=A0ACC1ATZ5_9ROSI|nr:hypothetical protein Patl1_14677 [Pistacia atlantica]